MSQFNINTQRSVFRDIAPYIWGEIPIDYQWAINTLVFKQYCEKNNITIFNV